jgi:DNA/RNA endonuclease G (NUC1)
MEATDGSGSFSSWVNLTQAQGTATSYLADTQRIGYGITGFETFTVDVPDRFRGKTATLRFEASGGTVYLDNVFFKSQHLMLGNPTEARTTDSPVPNLFYNNYLLDRAQYSTSFSGDSHIPNWSAWQLNNSWLGTGNRTNYFRDPNLGNIGLVSAKSSDYERPTTEISGTVANDGRPYIVSPGHLAPNADRNRTAKDAAATFSTANLLPQHQEHNEGIWLRLEEFTRALVEQQGREVYLYAGGTGENRDKPSMLIANDRQYGAYAIQVPQSLWKVFLVLDRPGLSLSEINSSNARAFAVWTRNTIPSPSDITWNQGGMDIITVAALESRLNADANNVARGIRYNFFSNLDSDLQRILKNTSVSVPPGDSPQRSFLLAEQDVPAVTSIMLGVSSDAPIRHGSVSENSIYEVGSTLIIPNIFPWNISATNNGILQVGSTQISTFHAGTPKISSYHGGICEVSSICDRMVEMGTTQISPSKISIPQIGRLEPGSLEISATEVDTLERALSKIAISKINPTQVSPIEGDISSDSTFEINCLEVPFPSSIALQQFTGHLNSLNSHNYSLQNTTVPTWLSFLTGTTPFNLNIAVTDLPTGQLAEAQLTGFAANGTPTFIGDTFTLALKVKGARQLSLARVGRQPLLQV